MVEIVNPSVCMDILAAAACNRCVCVRKIADVHGVQPWDVLDALTDLAAAGVIICRATEVSGFLSLSLGPKSLQAIFLFALNCDACGNLPPAVSSPRDPAAIVAAAIRPPVGENGPALGLWGRA